MKSWTILIELSHVSYHHDDSQASQDQTKPTKLGGKFTLTISDKIIITKTGFSNVYFESIVRISLNTGDRIVKCL